MKTLLIQYLFFLMAFCVGLPSVSVAQNRGWPEYADFGTALADVQEHYAVRGPMPSDRPGMYIFNLNDPRIIYYYSYDHYAEGVAPTRVPSIPDGQPRIGYWVDRYLGFFFNALPEKIYAFTPTSNGKYKGDQSDIRKKLLLPRITNELRSNPTGSNRLAMDLYRELLSSPIAKNPIVAYGLSNLKFEVIKQVNSEVVGSPTHFDRLRNTLYVNEEDLEKYGFVVILHECLHAALYRAFENGLISKTAHDNLVRMNQRRFPDYTGYVGAVGWPEGTSGVFRTELNLSSSGDLGPEKAYALGYTYTLLNYYRNQLTSSQRRLADLFMDAVESNKKISTVTIKVPTFPDVSFDLRLIHDGKNTKDRNAKVKAFIDAFTNAKSGPRKDIQILYDALKK